MAECPTPTFAFDTCGSDFDTWLRVLDAATGAELASMRRLRRLRHALDPAATRAARGRQLRRARRGLRRERRRVRARFRGPTDVACTPQPTPAPTPAPSVVGRNHTRLPFSCDFEAGFCGSPRARPYQWERTKGDTPSDETGPSSDHSTGRGFYVFTEASSRELPGQAVHA